MSIDFRHNVYNVCKDAGRALQPGKKAPGKLPGLIDAMQNPTVSRRRKGRANTASARWNDRHSTNARRLTDGVDQNGPMKPPHTNVQWHCTKGNGGLQCGSANLDAALACYPAPPTPQCARVALTQGRNPQAPQSPGGFALANAGRASQPGPVARWLRQAVHFINTRPPNFCHLHHVQL